MTGGSNVFFVQHLFIHAEGRLGSFRQLHSTCQKCRFLKLAKCQTDSLPFVVKPIAPRAWRSSFRRRNDGAIETSAPSTYSFLHSLAPKRRRAVYEGVEHEISSHRHAFDKPRLSCVCGHVHRLGRSVLRDRSVECCDVSRCGTSVFTSGRSCARQSDDIS